VIIESSSSSGSGASSLSSRSSKSSASSRSSAAGSSDASSPSPNPGALLLFVGPVLLYEDRPSPPTDISDVSGATYDEVDVAASVAHYTNPPTWLIPVRGAASTYAALAARAFGGGSASFVWVNATHRISSPTESYADLVLGQGDSVLITVRATVGGSTLVRSVQAATFTITPDITVPGLQNQVLLLDFTGFSFSNDEQVQVTFGPGVSTISTVVVNPTRLRVVISTSGTATPGLRTVKITRQGEDVTTAEALTVYGGPLRGTMDNLILLLNRPASTDQRPVLVESGLGTGPRTAEQDTRIQAVLDATDRNTIRAAWNKWTRLDCSLTVRPSTITTAQLDVLVEGAIAMEAAASSQPAIPGAPPKVPLSMWRGFLQFLYPLESAFQSIGSVVAMASATSENSYGLLQFNDNRASGNNFTAPGITVPIFNAGIVTNWKDVLFPITTLAQLKIKVDDLGRHDWRADPYSSLVNLIRSSQAYYARLIMAPNGTGSFVKTDSFRVDAGSGRANGQGSQRDCFEYFAVVHRLPSDCFGGTFQGVNYQGGVVLAPTPNEWHTTGGTPPYMTSDGTTRANQAQTYYNANAPAGGYQ
jgi:hypothetical protein